MTTRLALIAMAIVVVASCEDSPVVPAGDFVAVGVWGANGAGMIVGDTNTHVHVGCTLGDVSGRIPLDDDGRFDVEGSYLLKAYPIAIGPTMPARFMGRVVSNRLTLTVVVTDTIENKTTVVGPRTVEFGTQPQMSVCPICRPQSMAR